MVLALSSWTTLVDVLACWWHLAIISMSAYLLTTGLMGTTFSGIRIQIEECFVEKMQLKMASALLCLPLFETMKQTISFSLNLIHFLMMNYSNDEWPPWLWTCTPLWLLRFGYHFIGVWDEDPVAQMFQIAKFMGPTWDPPGSCQPQMGPMLAPWTLLSGVLPLHTYTCKCSYPL